MEATALITAQDLCIGYKGRKEKRLHQNLSFSLFTGELTCLLGANGSGKSTLLRTLAASQPYLNGEILLDGKSLLTYSEQERSRKIGVVLTDKTQAGGLTVYDLVALGRQPHTGFFGRLTHHDHHVISSALESVGITSKARHYIAELSDGERQKAMIAKALVQECPLILLDEPTAFLDVVSRIEIMTLLHNLAEQQQKAILLSTHDVEQALALSDKLWLLSREKGLHCGVTEDMIFSNQMDTLFISGNIRFDALHGTYYNPVHCMNNIHVEASDELLLHWTMNALHRHHYSCQATESPAIPNIPRLIVSSPQDIQLYYEGEQHSFTSFEELISFMK